MTAANEKHHNQQSEKVGVLLSNLGTPDEATASAVKRYLKEFLWDPRVVEQPRWLWWLLLHGVILNIRPKKSAAAYQTVWTEKGSPLMAISRDQENAIRVALHERFGDNIVVELAMRYGNPSIQSALESLQFQGCKKLLIFPLYPQYSATTTASTFDAVADVLKTWRRVPALRMIDGYHDDDAYIQALADSVRAHRQKHGKAERLLLSFHGIPQRYFKAGDPYPCLCWKTGRLLREALGLNEENYKVSFQSRFGREAWVEPYTDATLKAWGEAGVADVDVICPGFSADCLETLEEIRVENAAILAHSGGGTLRYIAALNAEDNHISCLSKLIARNLQGWL
ncbi:MAG: ferrochelatase [Mariprofundaceae bacterium]|nr:ferrochelatase [Mariprofundaceae bacterium]